MNRLFAAALCLLSLTTFAQRWERHLGLNVGPLLSRSLEVTYELTTPDRNGAVFFNVGNAFNARISNPDAPSGPGPYLVETRTSGMFGKIGGKVYVNPYQRIRFFGGIELIAARYGSTRLSEFIPDFPPYGGMVGEYPQRGWVAAFGGALGVNTQFYRRLGIDAGVQMSKPISETDKTFFFPGVGATKVAVPVQAILSLKYRLRP